MGTLRARRTDDVEDLADQPVDRGGTDLGVGRTVVSEVEAPNINMRTSGMERMSGGAKRQCGQDHRSVGDLPLEEVKALGEAVLPIGALINFRVLATLPQVFGALRDSLT